MDRKITVTVPIALRGESRGVKQDGGIIDFVHREIEIEVLPANMALADLVRDWAQRKNATPSQVALAWLLSRKPWIVPIPGTTRAAHLRQNLGAAELRFTPAELAELDVAVAAVHIQGERLPTMVAAMSGVEAPLPR